MSAPSSPPLEATTCRLARRRGAAGRMEAALDATLEEDIFIVEAIVYEVWLTMKNFVA